eukprot:gene14889-biopygen20145
MRKTKAAMAVLESGVLTYRLPWEDITAGPGRASGCSSAGRRVQLSGAQGAAQRGAGCSSAGRRVQLSGAQGAAQRGAGCSSAGRRVQLSGAQGAAQRGAG